MFMSYDFVKRYRVLPRPAWVRTMRVLTDGMMHQRGVRVHYHSLEHVPSKPCVIVANSTHKYEVVLLRWALDKKGIGVIIGSKGKNFHAAWMRHFGTVIGSLPLVSRGYILTSDFIICHKRRPTQVEYELLRAHVDTAAPLPSTQVFTALSSKKRAVLGYPFDPSECTYGQCVSNVYYAMMQQTLDHARTAVNAGYHVLIFPQGSVSSRLTPGHNGALQLALALGLQVVPLGVSGCREVFPNVSPWPVSGDVQLCFSGAEDSGLEDLPKTFRPFHPDDEKHFRPTLDRATHGLMNRINGLLDETYRWASNGAGDGAQGTWRFV